MWTCSGCGTRIGPDFEVCWRCGTSVRGEADFDFVTADDTPAIEDPTDYLRLEPGKLTERELPDPPLELVACFQGEHLAEATFVTDLLAAEGIPSVLENTSRPGAGDQNNSLIASNRVMVRSEDWFRVVPIVERFRDRKRSRKAKTR